MWSAYLALNVSVFTQSLGGIDTTGRAHAKRARRELFCLPARVLTHARSLLVRFAPATRTSGFDTAWGNLRDLPTARAG